MTRISPLDLDATYARLRPDASIEPLPVGSDFWQRIGRGELGSFHHEYLVTSHAFDTDWPTWEMHPAGDEIVCLLSGAVTFVLEREGREEEIVLDGPARYVVVPRGTWHTARARGPARMLFITAGEGTEHREKPR